MKVDKLTGADVAKLHEAKIIRTYEARQATGFAAVPDGWRCPHCGFVYEDPEKDIQESLLEKMEPEPTAAKPVVVTETGMVVTDLDQLSPEEVVKAGEAKAGEAFVATQEERAKGRPVARPA